MAYFRRRHRGKTSRKKFGSYARTAYYSNSHRRRVRRRY